MISKSISTSRKVNRLPDRVALLYTWLIPHTDDFGRLEGDALSIKAKIVPMRNCTESEIIEDLALIEKHGLIEQYEVKGEKYLQIIGFEDFQTFRIDRPRRALYPNIQGKMDGGIPQTYQSHTTDVPMTSKRQRKISNKLSISKDKRIG